MTDQWKCDDCGLVHQHDKTTHSMWDHIDWEQCKKLDWNPYCNCGAYEAVVRGFIDGIHPMVPVSVEDQIESVHG